MTREKQSHNFVAQLPVAHTASIIVLCLKQHGEQVTLILSTRSTLIDDAKHDAVDFTDGLMERIDLTEMQLDRNRCAKRRSSAILDSAASYRA